MRQRQIPDDSGDEALLRALRELGADYEPDLVAITHRAERVHPGQPGPRRDRRPVLLPAAAVLLVMGGVALAFAPRPDFGSAPAAIDPASAPTVVAASPGEPTPPASRSAGAPARPPVTVTTPASRPAAEVTVETLTTVTEVDLGRPGLRDWLVLGARSDRKQVRAKAAAADPLIILDQPAAATSDPGPFRITWSGGSPEQDHTAGEAWLAAPARPGLTVSIAAASRPRTVVLYTGATGGDASVSVSGTGITAGRTRLGSASSPARALRVTISLPATSAPTRIRLRGPADGEAARVYLSLVTVR